MGYFKPCFAVSEIGSCELMIKEEFDVRHGLEFIEESFVQATTISSIKCLNYKVRILSQTETQRDLPFHVYRSLELVQIAGQSAICRESSVLAWEWFR